MDGAPTSGGLFGGRHKVRADTRPNEQGLNKDFVSQLRRNLRQKIWGFYLCDLASRYEILRWIAPHAMAVTTAARSTARSLDIAALIGTGVDKPLTDHPTERSQSRLRDDANHERLHAVETLGGVLSFGDQQVLATLGQDLSRLHGLLAHARTATIRKRDAALAAT